LFRFCIEKIQIFLGKIGIALRLTSISKYLKLIRTTFPSPAPGIPKMVSFSSYLLTGASGLVYAKAVKNDGQKWRIAEQVY
jgi:hypothetical protein